MLKWKIVCTAAGVLVTILGYFAFFRKEYFIVKRRNYFAPNGHKDERKEEKAIRRNALFLFIYGIVLLLAGIALIIFA